MGCGAFRADNFQFPSGLRRRHPQSTSVCPLSSRPPLDSQPAERAILALSPDWPLPSEWCTCAVKSCRKTLCAICCTTAWFLLNEIQRRARWWCVCTVAPCGRRTSDSSLVEQQPSDHLPSDKPESTYVLRSKDKNPCQCAQCVFPEGSSLFQVREGG